ncbi:MAG: PIN domain-containing protein [SAR202 cluster bacterium]|nr:PIN domain-containing protein [SAR202 cluster bacterium]
MALVLDTGPLYATLDRTDAQNRRCLDFLEGTAEALVIPAPVLIEVDWLVHNRLHSGVFLVLLDDIFAGSYHVEELQPSDYRRIREICDRYADTDIGFVDAAVLAIVERLNEPKLATLDYRHFRFLRPRHVDTLKLVPEDQL